MKNKFNGALMTRLLNVLEQKEGSEEKLKELVNSLWTLRENLNEDVCNYTFLFELKYRLIDELESKRLPFANGGEGKDVTIDLINRTVGILSFSQEREVIIKLKDNEMSDALWEFLFEIINNGEAKLDLREIEETYTTTTDIDLSGLW